MGPAKKKILGLHKSWLVRDFTKGWVSNKWLPVSHLLHGIWPSSLFTCFTGGPLSSGEENREMKKQQAKLKNVKQERENISPHPEEDKEEYHGQ